MNEKKTTKNIYLQSFQRSSVSMVVETDHDGMMLTLEVQTKIPVATETWRSWCEQGSLLSSWQQAWPSTRVLSQQLLSSVRPPPPPPLPPQPPGCQSAWLVWAKQAPAIGPKGQWNCCQLGQHFTAEHHSPNKQCSGPQATGNMEPVITSRAWLVHSPKPEPGQGLERVLHLTQISQPGYVIRESLYRIIRSSAYGGIYVSILPLTKNVEGNVNFLGPSEDLKDFQSIADKSETVTNKCKTWEWKEGACQTVS